MKLNEDKIINEIEKALVVLGNNDVRYWVDRIVKHYLLYAKQYGYDEGIRIESVSIEENNFILRCYCGAVKCLISHVDNFVKFSFKNLYSGDEITITNTDPIQPINLKELLFDIFD